MGPVQCMRKGYETLQGSLPERLGQPIFLSSHPIFLYPAIWKADMRVDVLEALLGHEAYLATCKGWRNGKQAMRSL